MNMLIIPAILEKKIQEVKKKIKFCDGKFKIIQIDICDGKFVKNKTLNNPREIKKIKTKSKFEIHLMVENPIKEIKKWAFKNVKRIIFHYEALKNPISDIKKLKIFRQKYQKIEIGMAINPKTSIKVLEKNPLNVFSEILFLGVTPGKQGQKFQPTVLKKIKTLQQSDWKPKWIKIGVDGGVNNKIIPKLRNLKVDYIVIGSYFWKKNLPQ